MGTEHYFRYTSGCVAQVDDRWLVPRDVVLLTLFEPDNKADRDRDGSCRDGYGHRGSTLETAEEWEGSR
ncbi:hypothetical protein GCM10027610_013190 [Dactylosporangium cerinum]